MSETISSAFHRVTGRPGQGEADHYMTAWRVPPKETGFDDDEEPGGGQAIRAELNKQKATERAGARSDYSS